MAYSAYRAAAATATAADRHEYTQRVVSLLGEARNLATAAGCRQLAPKIRRCLKSAEGAERHAYGRVGRVRDRARCDSCLGTGKYDAGDPCNDCGGKGTVPGGAR